jgi:hypothetical protein
VNLRVGRLFLIYVDSASTVAEDRRLQPWQSRWPMQRLHRAYLIQGKCSFTDLLERGNQLRRTEPLCMIVCSLLLMRVPDEEILVREPNLAAGFARFLVAASVLLVSAATGYVGSLIWPLPRLSLPTTQVAGIGTTGMAGPTLVEGAPPVGSQASRSATTPDVVVGIPTSQIEAKGSSIVSPNSSVTVRYHGATVQEEGHSAQEVVAFYRYPTIYGDEVPPTMPPGASQPYVQSTQGVWYRPGADNIKIPLVPGFDPVIDPDKVILW